MTNSENMSLSSGEALWPSKRDEYVAKADGIVRDWATRIFVDEKGNERVAQEFNGEEISVELEGFRESVAFDMFAHDYID